jgi:hypothetical protein
LQFMRIGVAEHVPKVQIPRSSSRKAELIIAGRVGKVVAMVLSSCTCQASPWSGRQSIS